MMPNPSGNNGNLAEAWPLILQYLGWGDAVEGGVWFMGLEESKTWTEQDVRRHLAGVACPFEPITAQVSADPELGHAGAAIRTRTARIAAALSRSHRAKEPDLRWREYAETRLWRPDSHLCQGNLYPLGKPKLKVWPSDYTRWFGFDATAYRATCDRDRTQVVQDWFGKLKPSAVICFGESGWPYFKTAFAAEGQLTPNETAPHKAYPNLHAEFYRSGKSIIVLTPFLARPMTNALADKVANRLVSLGVELP